MNATFLQLPQLPHAGSDRACLRF